DDGRTIRRRPLAGYRRLAERRPVGDLPRRLPRPGRGRRDCGHRLPAPGWRAGLSEGGPVVVDRASVFPVIAGVVALGMSPHEEVAAPRVHCEEGPVFVEGRIGEAVQATLPDA